jgi:hypothetical protein
LTVIAGSCICGGVRYEFEGVPDSATACNCTACRRYGVLWAYGYEGQNIAVAGTTTPFIRDDFLAFHFCPGCGAVAYWRGLNVDDEGRRAIAVNLRLAEPGAVAAVPVRHFDGLDRFQAEPDDGRCVADYWY